MNITNERYKNTSASVSSAGNNRQPCLAARTHDPEDHHELLENINKDRIAFIDGFKNCPDCLKVLEAEYSDLLNQGHISITFAHYLDITDETELSNLANMAYCSHADPKTLQEGFKMVFDDFTASVRDRKYLANIKNEYTAIEYLREQNFTITDADYDSDIKFIISLPAGRVSITEQESKAISLLSNRPIIVNFTEKKFWALCDMEVMKEK